MSQDGVEIHFDEENGVLELACEPNSFAQYREIARDQLRGFPEISIDKVVEMNIVDAGTYVARRDARKGRLGGWIVALAIIAILVLAVVGAISLIATVLR